MLFKGTGMLKMLFVMEMKRNRNKELFSCLHVVMDC